MSARLPIPSCAPAPSSRSAAGGRSAPGNADPWGLAPGRRPGPAPINFAAQPRRDRPQAVASGAVRAASASLLPSTPTHPAVRCLPTRTQRGEASTRFRRGGSLLCNRGFGCGAVSGPNVYSVYGVVYANVYAQPVDRIGVFAISRFVDAVDACPSRDVRACHTRMRAYVRKGASTASTRLQISLYPINRYINQRVRDFCFVDAAVDTGFSNVYGPAAVVRTRLIQGVL